jgi:TRAP-type C4-dicarboxylate transport system permease small subunit
VLTWAGYDLFHEALVNGWTTDTVWALPLWIPYISLPIGIGLLSLQYVADILALLTGHSMPFAMDAHSPFEGE